MDLLKLRIEGTSPLLICRFSKKAIQQIREQQEAGSAGKSRKIREPKNFAELFQDAKHVSYDGWEGFHAGAIRNAAISACRTCGVVMTKAKLAFSVRADGFDIVDDVPLVRIIGEAEESILPVRNKTGVVDLRARPIYRKWSAILTIRHDRDMLTATDMANLICRVGMQVGIGEGRPDSKDSAGMGFGLFEIV
jgi:hypothetical protein